MHEYRVAVAGFGTVGRAVATLLLSRRARYRERYGTDVRLVAVCGSSSGVADRTGLEGNRFDRLEAGMTGPEFIAASGADAVVEAGPTDYRSGAPALGYLRSALLAGRDAIVVSKAALVRNGRELRALAQASGSLLRVSGAAGAALPTIGLVEHDLLGCKVLEIKGILNATTSHMLDAMAARGLGYASALEEAQAGGFAERDPRNDVEGWDTACKLLILANFGLGADLSLDEVGVQGIQCIAAGELHAWREAGVVPRLVGHLTREAGRFRIEVGVRTYAEADAFAHIPAGSKAIRVRTDAMGEVMATASGPEPAATAAAALKDLELILGARSAHQVPARAGSSHAAGEPRHPSPQPLV